MKQNNKFFAKSFLQFFYEKVCEFNETFSNTRSKIVEKRFSWRV